MTRTDQRDDRVIWRIVKTVAERAGIVDCHVHALRAAFAVFYLDRNPDDLLGLKDLLGHKSLNTTLIYLRRRNRQAGMESVRSLSWGVTPNGLNEGDATNLAVTPPASGGGRIRTSDSGVSSPGTGHSVHLPDALLSEAREAAESDRAEGLEAVHPTKGMRPSVG